MINNLNFMDNSRYLISILALNVKGQLSKVTSFFGEHNLNILRLVLSAADRYDKVHRTIAYVEGDYNDVEKMCDNLKKLENVIDVINFKTNGEYIEKELCLIKVLPKNKMIKEITSLIKSTKGEIIAEDKNFIIFKVEEREEVINNLMDNLINLDGNIGFYRSGIVAASLDDEIDIL